MTQNFGPFEKERELNRKLRAEIAALEDRAEGAARSSRDEWKQRAEEAERERDALRVEVAIYIDLDHKQQARIRELEDALWELATIGKFASMETVHAIAEEALRRDTAE